MTEPLTAEGTDNPIVDAAVEAYRRGYMPLPLLAREKRPAQTQWTQHRRDEYGDAQGVATAFHGYAERGWTNLGIALGEPSSGLVDVDLDHPKTIGLKNILLPVTSARSGRTSSPNSHYWYQIAEGEDLPQTRRYKMPDGSVSVELRATRGQTAIAPSLHPSGEAYRWDSLPWGGEDGPRVVGRKQMATSVALLALGTVLVDGWPRKGGRHDAYLALSGALLRLGRTGVNSLWEANIEALIIALAEATHDEDGPEVRVREAVHTTLERLRAQDEHVTGWPTLAESIGEPHVKAARRLVAEVESLWGYDPEEDRVAVDLGDDDREQPDVEFEHDPEDVADDGEEDEAANPLGTWVPTDWEPYIAGLRPKPVPTLLTREDGVGLLYARRLNLLYGKGGSAKSWIAAYACLQEMRNGDRVLYLDLEDDASLMFDRLQAMGAGYDDIRKQFAYINPEETLASMMQNRWGDAVGTLRDARRELAVREWVRAYDPTLIVIDAMAGLAQMHGLDTNSEGPVEAVGHWAKSLMDGTRATVLLIDHGTKAAGMSSDPIGSGRKRNMTRGTMLHAWIRKEPVDGGIGQIDLLVNKDTPSQVKKHAVKGPKGEQIGASVVIDSTLEGTTKMTVSAPRPTVTEKTKVQMDFEDERLAQDEQMTREHEALRQVLEVKAFERDTEILLTGRQIEEATGIVWRNNLDKIMRDYFLVGDQPYFRKVQTGGPTTARYGLAGTVEVRP